MIIAVDFDGTICAEDWPRIGEANEDMIYTIRDRQARGDKFILWTCREGQLLMEAIEWCQQRGIEFDAINDNLPEQKKKYRDNPRKVSADEYWDDRAVPVSYKRRKGK